jgi:hypothetical protein
LQNSSTLLDFQFSATCRGFICDQWGPLVAGFSCNLRACTITHAELWPILLGLKLARSHCLLNIIESYSSTSVCFITDGSNMSHHAHPLLHVVNLELEGMASYEVVHMYCEANTITNGLANHGHSCQSRMMVFDSVPYFISCFFF